jgi:hypothetical protein
MYFCLASETASLVTCDFFSFSKLQKRYPHQTYSSAAISRVVALARGYFVLAFSHMRLNGCHMGFIYFCLVMLITPLLSQASAVSEPVLEVRVEQRGRFEPADYTYLRILKNGSVVSQDRKGPEGPFTTRTGKLTAAEQRSLMALIGKKEIGELATEFPPTMVSPGYSLIVTITITRGSKQQTIHVQNYNLAAGREKGIYPPALGDLMCGIEGFRGDSSIHLTEKADCGVANR